MVDVLYFSDRDVKRKLFERVDSATRPLIVAQLRQDRLARPPQEREPFVSIEREFGDVVDLVLVADEGTNEGMWRDPVGDLADRFFPDDRHAAYAAATGYMLIRGGRVLAHTKKHGAPPDDLWSIQEALHAHVPGVPPPDPSKRPGKQKGRSHASAPSSGRRIEDEDTNPRARVPPRSAHSRANVVAAPAAASDPWALLGIARGTPLADAKKAFRTLIAQYHPDKVSHLAPEFRELADRKTREILEAWQRIEAEGAE